LPVDAYQPSMPAASPAPRLRLPSWLRNLLSADLRSQADLRRYILRISAVSVAVALSADIVNQLVFFESWTETLRSWTITVLISGGLALPISRAIGKAHLELYRAKRAVEVLSLTDALTGLANRRALIDAAARQCKELTLAIFDIDRFKHVNDTYGHLAGDTVIAGVAHLMQARLGPIGDVYRLGGEEFALLSGDGANAVAAVRSLIDEVATAPIGIGTRKVNVTISAGIADGSGGDGFNQVYADADRALYLAKTSGRNRVALASDLPPVLRAVEAGDAHDGERRHNGRRSIA
jgi:diguanylate cyclase (GGDEF)-like protein